jgi:ketosteroid isomerase-like protein
LEAQTGKTASTKNLIDSTNRLIDRAVVQKQLVLLQKLYADDFVFTHGTGLVDSKSSWLKNIRDTNVHFIYREHDSVLVELHNDVAIVTGTLTVKRKMQNELNAYALRYVRVFTNRRNQWQMISHRTASEWHLKIE